MDAKRVPGVAGHGLTRHIQAAKKDGSAIVFGKLAGKDRTNKGVVSIDAIGLDQDDGPEPEESIPQFARWVKAQS